MKIRIRENTLRIRITQSELKDLSHGKSLRSSIDFPSGDKLRYSIIPSHDDTTKVEMINQDIKILLGIIDHDTMMDESTVGVQSIHQTKGRPLELLIEKDFSCLHPRAREDVDTFPNPNKKKSANG